MEGINLHINSFMQAAQQAQSADSTIKLTGNTLKNVNGFCSFFTLASTHRETMSAFLNSIKQKYGETIYQMASNQLNGPMEQGKPLTAGMIKQVEAKARHNVTLAAGNFISGVSPDGTPAEYNLDNAINACIERMGRMGQEAVPLDSDSLRYEIKDAVAKDLLSGRLALGSEQEMFEAVKNGIVGGIYHMLARDRSPVAPEGFLFRTPGNLEDKCRLCVLTAPNHADKYPLAFASLYLGRMRELQNDGPLTRSTIWQACFSGEALPPEADNPRDFAAAFNTRLEKLEKALSEGLPPSDSVPRALKELPHEIIHAARHEGRNLDGTMRLESLGDITLETRAPTLKSMHYRMFSECAGWQKRFSGGPLTFTFHHNGSDTTLSMVKGQNMIQKAWQEVDEVVNQNKDPDGNAELGKAVRGFASDFDAQVNQLGIPEPQLRPLYGAMCQNSHFLLFRLEQAVGHSLDSNNAKYAFDISRNTDTGDIYVRHSTWTRPEGGGEDDYSERSHLTLTIHPDGSVDGTAPVFITARPVE